MTRLFSFMGRQHKTDVSTGPQSGGGLVVYGTKEVEEVIKKSFFFKCLDPVLCNVQFSYAGILLGPIFIIL